ncbi:MFS transporter [Sphingomonas sp.]|uniref:MFS transporter n=1 Tax=Sphingomonas sp. TaxID=28214 RepID=UPI00286A8118|nr:MFS transporter [Sphingomonas sp.]
MIHHESVDAPPADASSLTRGQVMLVALIFFATALNYVDRQVLALLKPTLQQEFHWTDQQFAHLGSSFQLAAAGTLLFVGWIVDRFGVRVAYGVAVLLWSMAGMAHALAATVQQFVLARIALASAESVNTPAAVKAAAMYLPLRARSLGIGIVNTAPNIGAILTPLLIPPFAVAFGWRASFVVTGSLGFVWLIFWVVGTRSIDPIIAAPVGEQRAKVDLRALLADRRSWAVIGAKAFSDLVWWFVLFWMPDFFNRQFGMSQASLGGPIAIIFTLAALGALTSGGLFPILLSRGLSINAARKGSMLFFALVVLLMPLALTVHSPWTAALLIGAGLFAHQGFSTNIFGMATDIVPAGRIATVIAFGAVAGNLTGTGIIEFAGWSLDHGHGYAPLFLVCGSAYLVALGWIHLLQPHLTLDGEK